MAAQHVVGQLTAFGGHEFLAAGCLEDGAALLYDVRDVLCAEFHDFVGDQAAVAAIDAFYFKTCEYGRACDGADGGVHAGGVAAGCKYANGFDFCHV